MPKAYQRVRKFVDSEVRNGSLAPSSQVEKGLHKSVSR
jgi:hypothetical protein